MNSQPILSVVKKLIPEHWTLVKYAISGVIGIASNVGSLYVFTEIFAVWYLASAVLSYGVGLIVTFSLQKYWTFRKSGGSTTLQFVSYSTIALLSLLINIGLLYVFVEWFKLWYLLSQVVALGMIAVMSYVANRFFTFSKL